MGFLRRLPLFLLALFPLTAQASIIPSLPYTFTNGTVADATQVNGNFNTIVTDVNANAATAGANTNITSISGLTTPLASTYGGTTVYTGGTSGGSGNAQTLATVTPSNFALTAGNIVTGIAGFTNTSTMTLSVNSTTAKAVDVENSTGLHALSGGEVFTGNSYTFYYDGTEYILLNPSLITGNAIASSVALAGSPTTTTQTSLDNSTKVATTAMVQSAIAAQVPQLHKQIITATGAFTFTTPAGTTTSTVYKLTLTAGGGGGGGGTTPQGGSGGETVIKWITGLSPSTGYTGSIGTGGAAGSSGAGGNGANSTFTDATPTTYTAHAGTGGSVAIAAGPVGGTGGNGDMNIPGGNGGNAYSSSSTDKGGQGGGTFWGPGSADNAASTQLAGVDAVVYGAGGSGGGTTTGGAGKSGVAVFEWMQ